MIIDATIEGNDMVRYRRLYLWIDKYPDYSFYAVFIVNALIQLVLGVLTAFIILVSAIMLVNFAVVLASNLLVKNLFRRSRPSTYYVVHGRGAKVFEGSFPSLHAQFAFAMATTFIISLYLYVNVDISSANLVVGVPLIYFMAFIVASSRYLIGVHHLVDVVGGIVLGVVLALPITIYMYDIMKEASLAIQVLLGTIFFLTVYILSFLERKHLSS